MKRKNDFLIIPNEIAFDKKISSTAKLLYAEIAYLCNIEGFCWASNGYLGRIFGVDNRTVQRLIRQLKDNGYIFFNTPDKNVAPCDKNVAPCDKIVADLRQICLTPRDKNVTQSNNNKRNKNSYKQKSPDFSAYDLDLYEEMIRNND